MIFGMTENPGGVESFLINYYRHLDKNNIQFDFLNNSHITMAYEKEILALGGRTFYITARSQNRKEYKRQLEDLFKKHASDWSAIWVNVCSLANIDYLKVAKKYGIEKRIVHSHNSQNMDSALRGLLHKWNKLRIKEYATDFWACSVDAAHWFYRDDLMKKVQVIHNAIDLKRLEYDANKRNLIRKQYDWQNKYIIGNIGRLHFQKNQSFAIDVFEEYHKQNTNSLLILIGQGEDEQELKKQAKERGIESDVYFAGVQEDIQGWLSTFDLFLFPSKFEGLSIAALEAQANGLPVIASKGVIPEEVRMNTNFEFFDLHKEVSDWSDKIKQMQEYGRMDCELIQYQFTEKGYNIKTEVSKLERLLV